MTHLSLFSGIGGLDIAAEWAGFTTVGQCEWADYPTKVLEKHWPDVPRWRDIRTLTKESFYERTGLRTAELISGGFPCQPFSVAGNQKGKGDERYLWPEMMRVIRELTPRWVVGENVPGILRIAAADVVKDLEREGYNVVVFDFEAAAVGAVHRRERIAFVGNAKYDGRASNAKRRGDEAAGDRKQEEQPTTVESPRAGRPTDVSGVCGCAVEGDEAADADGWKSDTGNERITNCETLAESFTDGSDFNGAMADVARAGMERQSAESPAEPEAMSGKGQPYESGSATLYDADSRNCRGYDGRRQSPRPENGRWWAAEPDVGRVAHGVSSRVDRLKCLGNAVVPQQFYPIFRAIEEEETA